MTADDGIARFVNVPTRNMLPPLRFDIADPDDKHLATVNAIFQGTAIYRLPAPAAPPEEFPTGLVLGIAGGVVAIGLLIYLTTR